MKEEDFPRLLQGRMITGEDLTFIRQLIANNPEAARQQLADELCRRWQWHKPDGSLKDMAAKLLLLKLDRAGLIQLPPPKSKLVNNPKPVERTPEGEPKPAITGPLVKLLPLKFERVTKANADLFKELIDRYHYLGYTRLVGAQICYLVYSQAGLVAALSFSAAAWKVKPRDRFIGWNDRQRSSNLYLVVNNSRFLILPWVKCKNLASKLLSQATQQLKDDWQKLYGYTPVLLETFVDVELFAGTCYRAANWIYVGYTQGRGRYDRFHKRKLSEKDIFLFPLRKDFREFLLKEPQA